LKNEVQVSNANAQISNADISSFHGFVAACISDTDVLNDDALNADAQFSNSYIRVYNADAQVSDADIQVSNVDAQGYNVDIQVSNANLQCSNADAPVSNDDSLLLMMMFWYQMDDYHVSNANIQGSSALVQV
jgi:hypothetical protein